MEWMLLPLRRYAQFSGRAQRKEYWMFALFVVLGSLVLSGLDTVLGLGGHASSYTVNMPGNYAAGSNLSGGILTDIFSLAIIIPSIAVAVRRLHDVDKSGWWLLIELIPIVGWIIVLVWACTEGTRGPNRFGPDPKADLGDLHETFR
jgi:uncharacterized membrane protein YhaH (DUF805 family)